MEGAKETLDKSILEIPNLIKSNQDIFSHVLTCKRDVAKNLRVYEEMMKELQVLKGLLADYGAGYIFIEDFKPNELQIIDPNDATGRSTTPFKISEFLMNMSSSQTSTIQQCPRGLWTAHQRGLQKRENREEKVTIKILLEHSNVAEFLGIQNSESYFPAMVYNKPLRTLDIIDSTGNIRLTGGCLPRKADLPGNQEQHISGDFVYLSPEVLRGDLYTASADAYAFGLLMFDMMSKTPAFDSQRKMSLDLFIKRINPKEMISLKTEQSNLSDDAIDIILRCLDISEESRPTLLNLQEQVEVLKTDQHAKHQAI
ncbi:MAP3K1 [Mytilus edulis]|uniref:MAP3K1 n=1 Tax=Mytilus edulis TaxID=6550 RepID=A0A8S3VLS9_MYTED|nr:MAP3K1 [Mytilus edulis]